MPIHWLSAMICWYLMRSMMLDNGLRMIQRTNWHHDGSIFYQQFFWWEQTYNWNTCWWKYTSGTGWTHSPLMVDTSMFHGPWWLVMLPLRTPGAAASAAALGFNGIPQSFSFNGSWLKFKFFQSGVAEKSVFFGGFSRRCDKWSIEKSEICPPRRWVCHIIFRLLNDRIAPFIAFGTQWLFGRNCWTNTSTHYRYSAWFITMWTVCDKDFFESNQWLMVISQLCCFWPSDPSFCQITCQHWAKSSRRGQKDKLTFELQLGTCKPMAIDWSSIIVNHHSQPSSARHCLRGWFWSSFFARCACVSKYRRHQNRTGENHRPVCEYIVLGTSIATLFNSWCKIFVGLSGS